MKNQNTLAYSSQHQKKKNKNTNTIKSQRKPNVSRLEPRNRFSERGWTAILSVFLTAPCCVGVLYLLLLQTYRLRLEYCLCTLQIALYLTEVWYAIVFVFSLCRPVTYD
ncbi:uncharacterized protein LOC6564027 isoform X2 [Drosophila grimshawi]|uniref:uncharacterized protein LOC6564027 isoform X2 n=1 Tax=Drosophila grimshawi TaxID=7222 RepID=UPI000C86F60F|nr:uncharacterized protein LOC6564027 isoform X2 [Drosophila grimshawi]